MSGFQLNPNTLSKGSTAQLQLPNVACFSNATSFTQRSVTLIIRRSAVQRRVSQLRYSTGTTSFCRNARRIQAAVQTDDLHTAHSCKLQLQEELKDTKRGIFGLKAGSMCVVLDLACCCQLMAVTLQLNGVTPNSKLMLNFRSVLVGFQI